MKLLLWLILGITVLLADSSDIFDYRNYNGNTDYTLGKEDWRIKYVLEKLTRQNKLDLIRDEYKKLKIDYPDDFDNEYVLDKAAANLLKQLPDDADDIAKMIASSKKEKLENEALVSKANQYFKRNGLSNIMKVETIVKDDDENLSSEIKYYKHKLNFNYDVKMSTEQKNNLIKLQKKMAHCQDEKELEILNATLIDDLETYLVKYAIKSKDEDLMKSILLKGEIDGNGCNASYTEYITQNQYIPFYLHYPNIDKYLNQEEAEKAASHIYDMIELYNQKTGDDADKGIWIKYNSTFIFPYEGKEKEFKYIDFIKMIGAISPRIAKEVSFYHYDNVLRINGFMNE